MSKQHNTPKPKKVFTFAYTVSRKHEDNTLSGLQRELDRAHKEYDAIQEIEALQQEKKLHTLAIKQIDKKLKEYGKNSR